MRKNNKTEWEISGGNYKSYINFQTMECQAEEDAQKMMGFPVTQFPRDPDWDAGRLGDWVTTKTPIEALNELNKLKNIN